MNAADPDRMAEPEEPGGIPATEVDDGRIDETLFVPQPSGPDFVPQH